MASFNKVILMGNLTRDPQASSLPSGTPVTEFSLAVNRRWKDSQGNPREEVLFIDCTSFGKQAEALAKYLHKGNPIHVEGHLKLDSWEASDGTKRSKIRIIVEQFNFAGTARTQTSRTEPDATDPAPEDRLPATPAAPAAELAKQAQRRRPARRNNPLAASRAATPEDGAHVDEIPI